MLAQEANDHEEREHYARLRDAWTKLAKGCEPFNFSDVTESGKIDGPIWRPELWAEFGDRNFGTTSVSIFENFGTKN